MTKNDFDFRIFMRVTKTTLKLVENFLKPPQTNFSATPNFVLKFTIVILYYWLSTVFATNFALCDRVNDSSHADFPQSPPFIPGFSMTSYTCFLFLSPNLVLCTSLRDSAPQLFCSSANQFLHGSGDDYVAQLHAAHIIFDGMR